MKQNQQQDKQHQHQDQNQEHGERRHPSRSEYHGDERRKPDPMQQMPGGNPQGGNPGMRTQEHRDSQQKIQQEEDDKNE